MQQNIFRVWRTNSLGGGTPGGGFSTGGGCPKIDVWEVAGMAGSGHEIEGAALAAGGSDGGGCEKTGCTGGVGVTGVGALGGGGPPPDSAQKSTLVAQTEASPLWWMH